MTQRRNTSDRTQERARELRKNQTRPEYRLWFHLRNRRLAGLKFVRQSPVGSFIVDFFCREKRLVVELDGDSHTDRGEYDRHRQAILEAEGLRVLRVSNDEVIREIDGVLFAIVREAGLDAQAWWNGRMNSQR